MRILWTVLLIGAFLTSGLSQAVAGESNLNKPRPQPSQFARVMDDLPLMPGLNLVRENDVLIIFGPNRLADTTARGMVDVDTVYEYYAATLPQLGWKKLDARTFERENEVLHLDAKSSNDKGETIVRFSTKPPSGRPH